ANRQPTAGNNDVAPRRAAAAEVADRLVEAVGGKSDAGGGREHDRGAIVDHAGQTRLKGPAVDHGEAGVGGRARERENSGALLDEGAARARDGPREGRIRVGAAKGEGAGAEGDIPAAGAAAAEVADRLGEAVDRENRAGG